MDGWPAPDGHQWTACRVRLSAPACSTQGRARHRPSFFYATRLNIAARRRRPPPLPFCRLGRSTGGGWERGTVAQGFATCIPARSASAWARRSIRPGSRTTLEKAAGSAETYDASDPAVIFRHATTCCTGRSWQRSGRSGSLTLYNYLCSNTLVVFVTFRHSARQSMTDNPLAIL